MLKFGTVESVNPPHVKVKFKDNDGIDSYDLAVIMPFTLEDKASWYLSVGTQVACVMDENSEEGVVLGAIYSEADPAPMSDLNKLYLEFKDGSKIVYDKTSHELNADIKGSAKITALEKIELKSPIISMTGTVNITGTLVSTGDVTAGGISLISHKHGGVEPGGSVTGTAQ